MIYFEETLKRYNGSLKMTAIKLIYFLRAFYQTLKTQYCRLNLIKISFFNTELCIFMIKTDTTYTFTYIYAKQCGII